MLSLPKLKRLYEARVEDFIHRDPGDQIGEGAAKELRGTVATIQNGSLRGLKLDDPGLRELVLEFNRMLNNLDKDSGDFAMMHSQDYVAKVESPGGIDVNAAYLNLHIKRDSQGVPLPLIRQDMAQLSHLAGLNPVILSIQLASESSFLAEILSNHSK